MSPAVMLGQRLAESAGLQATVRWQISQRVTGSWVTVTGKRREDESLIWLYDASPDGVILPCASTNRPHSTRHESAGWAFGGAEFR